MNFRSTSRFLLRASVLVTFACGALLGGCETDGAEHDLCQPALGYVPDELPACGSTNEHQIVCTYVGPGFECSNGCWEQFFDGPCAPVPDAGNGPDGSP